VFNVVTAEDPARVGEVLTTDPRVDIVSFTGSTGVGRRIMAAAADTVKRVFLEQGGKSANSVLDDADIARVLPFAGMTCIHGGQGCAITTRLLPPPAVASGDAVVDDDEIIIGDADDDDDAEEEIAPIEEYVRTQLCEAVMRGKALAARSSRPTFVDLPAEDELSFEYNHPFEAYLRRIDPEHDVHAELARFRDEHAALLDSYSAEHERFATLRPLFEHAATVELVGRRAARTSSGARRLVARYRITYASRLLSPRLLEFDDDDEATTTLGYLEAVLALVSFDARARAHAWQCLPANVRSRLGKTVLATVFAAIDGNRRRRYEHLVGMYDDWCDVIEGAADSCADV
jgi:hypothetical protein